jgi:hypothetical protein
VLTSFSKYKKLLFVIERESPADTNTAFAEALVAGTEKIAYMEVKSESDIE